MVLHFKSVLNDQRIVIVPWVRLGDKCLALFNVLLEFRQASSQKGLLLCRKRSNGVDRLHTVRLKESQFLHNLDISKNVRRESHWKRRSLRPGLRTEGS